MSRLLTSRSIILQSVESLCQWHCTCTGDYLIRWRFDNCLCFFLCGIWCWRSRAFNCIQRPKICCIINIVSCGVVSNVTLYSMQTLYNTKTGSSSHAQTEHFVSSSVWANNAFIIPRWRFMQFFPHQIHNKKHIICFINQGGMLTLNLPSQKISLLLQDVLLPLSSEWSSADSVFSRP